MNCVKGILRVIGFMIAPGLFFTMQAQTLQIDWAKGYGGNSADVGKALVADGTGNLYHTGYFNGAMDADPGPAYLPLVSAGMQDIFLLKTNAAGKPIWAKSMGGSLGEMCNGIAMDEAGNLYLSGFFRGTADFDPGMSTFNLTSFSAYSQDIFVAKYDPNGNFNWAISFGGDGYFDSVGNLFDAVSGAYAIQYDLQGHLLISGSILGCIDFNPGVGVDSLSARFAPACFVVKLDTNGNLNWARQFGGGQHGTSGYSLQTDDSGNVFIGGVFGDSVDFDPGINTHWMHCEGENQAFVCKLNSAGNFCWARQFGGNSAIDQATAQSLAIDEFGHLVMVGHFKGNCDFDPGTGIESVNSNGQYDGFILKLDSNGQFDWVKRMGGFNSDYCYSVSIGISGLIYTTGNFRGTVNFSSGSTNTILTSASLFASDLFVSCHNQAGDLIHAIKIGGSSSDCGNAIFAASNGSVYLSGFLGGNTTFQTASQTQLINNFGGPDVFTMKLKEPVIPPLSVVNAERSEANYVCESMDVDAHRCIPKAGWKHEMVMRQRPLVYPMPSKGILTIEFPAPHSGQSVQVLDLRGNILIEQHLFQEKTVKLNLDSFCNGYYLLEVRYRPGDNQRIFFQRTKIEIMK